MMKKFSIFKNIVCNGIILVVVITIFAIVRAGTVFVSTKPQAILKGESDDSVALMINVSSGEKYLREILKILSDNGIKATFFVGGSWAVQNEQLLKEMHEEGHEIGNHGYYRKDFEKLSSDRVKEEIEITHGIVSNILGVEMNLFAPPNGLYSAATVEIAASLGYKTIIAPSDATLNDKGKIYLRATKSLSAGNFIPIYTVMEAVMALPDILSTIKSKNLSVTTVTKTLKNIV